VVALIVASFSRGMQKMTATRVPETGDRAARRPQVFPVRLYEDRTGAGDPQAPAQTNAEPLSIAAVEDAETIRAANAE
jgi:hypothetical protein